MTQLIELSSQKHSLLKVAPKAIIEYASKQHVLPLNAIEIAQAATCFPVFISRNNINGNWCFSAMTSFVLEQNLFVENGILQPVFQPSSLRAYPLYLMESPKDPTQYTIGFDPTNGATSETEGKPLFLEEGKASEHLTMVTRLLEESLQHTHTSIQFANKLEELDLLKEINLNVVYGNGQINTIKGLITINEDRFKMLSGETLAELNKAGYLMPIHALLMSIFQLNILINKNNANPDNETVSTVKMEITKAFSHN